MCRRGFPIARANDRNRCGEGRSDGAGHERRKTHRIGAGVEVILSLGAMNTPKLLMQSGIGDQAELQRCGIPLVQHLPGVGQNFQDHVRSACIWEYQEPLSPNSAGGATFFWKSNPSLSTPDIQGAQVEVCASALRETRSHAGQS